MVASVIGRFQSLYQILGVNPTMTGADMQGLLNQLFSFQSGVVAYSTGGATSAIALTATIVEVVSSNVSTSSVALPSALPGSDIVIINDSPNAIQVYGQYSNPSNAGAQDLVVAKGVTTAVSTGATQASGVCAEYVCWKLGTWKQLISA